MIHRLPATLAHAAPILYGVASFPKFVTSEYLPQCCWHYRKNKYQILHFSSTSGLHPHEEEYVNPEDEEKQPPSPIPNH